jgi:predicted metal-binding protein
MTTTLHVCTKCLAGEVVEDDALRPGRLLHAAIMAQGAPDGVTVRAVDCLSACSNGASVALSAPGKWTYVYGRMTVADAGEIIAGATAYAETDDGLVPWRARPVIFRKQSLARVPPMEISDE